MLRNVCCIVVATLLTGCSINHDYVWKEYEIDPARVHISGETDRADANNITLTSGACDTNSIVLGHIHGNVHYWHGSLQTLADAIVTQLAMELEKRNYRVVDGGGKSAEIKVTDYSLETGMWRYAYTVNVEITFGNGVSKSFEVRNASPAAPERGINGVIALATIEILNSPVFSDYMQ